MGCLVHRCLHGTRSWTLNWRRDPEIENEIVQTESLINASRNRMKQLESNPGDASRRRLADLMALLREYAETA